MLKKTVLGVLFAVFVLGLLIAGINFNVAKAVDYGSLGTTVGGIIWENTTWTLENSPYIITDTIQIPENVALTIEPGVTVTGGTIEIWGVIYACGTTDSKIVSRNAVFSLRGGFIDIDYCILDGGDVSSVYGGNINLRHSTIDNFNYIWIGHGHVNIECNLILKMHQIVDQNSGETYIRYNTFASVSEFAPDKPDSLSYPGYITDCYGGTIVQYNTLEDAGGIVLALAPFGYSNAHMIATENYWGTDNTTAIDLMIYDRKDNLNCASFIEYLPILTEPHPDSPTLPITVNFTYSPSIVYAHGAVTFDASTSFGPYSSIASYTWNFGDSNITTTMSPIVRHTYTTPDSYNVTLTVTDEFGFQNSTVTSLTVFQDDVPPMIGIPSRMPEGDVEPNQKVKVLVNVTDSLSGIKDVTLSYNLNDSAVWIDSPMTLNSTTGLYETAIQVQQAHTLVRYEITAYDNAGNHMVKDNSGQYYVYTVIPEFPSTMLLPLLMAATSIATVLQKKKRKTKPQLP